MDAIKDALKNKIKGVAIHMHDGSTHHAGDVSGDDSDSALHDAGTGIPGHKMENKSSAMPKDEIDPEDDRAPAVSDDPKHKLEGGGGGPEFGKPGMGLAANKGKPLAGHDTPDAEMAMLKQMTSGGAVGRKSMTLGERGQDKMKERMAAIQREKSHKS